MEDAPLGETNADNVSHFGGELLQAEWLGQEIDAAVAVETSVTVGLTPELLSIEPRLKESPRKKRQPDGSFVVKRT